MNENVYYNFQIFHALKLKLMKYFRCFLKIDEFAYTIVIYNITIYKLFISVLPTI